MKYVGLQQQITNNNRKSVLLLALFPILVLAMVYAFCFILLLYTEGQYSVESVNGYFISTIPFVLVAVAIWFVIAYFGNAKIINMTAQSHTLSRKENMRVYNLMENLCMSVGMTMPKLRIIESDALNAFASGINEKTYTVTLTRGIINTLNDEELEGVIAHELTHIRNSDVRLLIISIIFVGIFSFVMQLASRSIWYRGSFSGRGRKNDRNNALMIVIVLVLSTLAYFLSLIFKMALSRSREYLADAGAVELTRNPMALANALRKISGNSHIEIVKSKDLQEMYIEHTPPKKNLFGTSGLFATHPPIEKRIQYLTQLFNDM